MTLYGLISFQFNKFLALKMFDLQPNQNIWPRIWKVEYSQGLLTVIKHVLKSSEQMIRL